MTQKQIILQRIYETGSVSRNWALQNYISRLGAIIQTLEDEGYSFRTSRIAGNYYYTLTARPCLKKSSELSPSSSQHSTS